MGAWGGANVILIIKKTNDKGCSILIQNENTTILVDAGPDIKNQLIGHNIKKIDAVLITHQHSDHISGLDELRPFYFYNKVKLKIYTHFETAKFLINRFDYLFNKSSTSQSYFQPPFELINIDYFQDIKIGDINIKSIISILLVVPLMYFSTNYLDIAQMLSIFLLKVLIYYIISRFFLVPFLRKNPHIAHAHFDLSFKWIKEFLLNLHI